MSTLCFAGLLLSGLLGDIAVFGALFCDRDMDGCCSTLCVKAYTGMVGTRVGLTYMYDLQHSSIHMGLSGLLPCHDLDRPVLDQVFVLLYGFGGGCTLFFGDRFRSFPEVSQSCHCNSNIVRAFGNASGDDCFLDVIRRTECHIWR